MVVFARLASSLCFILFFVLSSCTGVEFSSEDDLDAERSKSDQDSATTDGITKKNTESDADAIEDDDAGAPSGDGSQLEQCGPDECREECANETPDMCGDSCVNIATDSTHCGECFNVCPEPGGAGRALCENGKCAMKCNDDYHLCESECVSNESTDSCGSRCEPCPIPPNARSTCDGSVCGFRCSSSSSDFKCDSDEGCVPNDNRNCGECGNDCTEENQICDGEGECVDCISDRDCENSSARYCIDQECKACNPNETNTCAQPANECREVICTSEGVCTEPTSKDDGIRCEDGRCVDGICEECITGSDCNTGHCTDYNCTECDSTGGCTPNSCETAGCSSSGYCIYTPKLEGEFCADYSVCDGDGECIRAIYGPEDCDSFAGDSFCTAVNERQGICVSYGYCAPPCTGDASVCPAIPGAQITCAYGCFITCIDGADCPTGMRCDEDDYCTYF